MLNSNGLAAILCEGPVEVMRSDRMAPVKCIKEDILRLRPSQQPVRPEACHGYASIMIVKVSECVGD